MPAIAIPIAILRGVEMVLPLLAKLPKMTMMIGVSTITKNGFKACQISGAILSVWTKSRANTDKDWPFWWKENQKKTAMPNTANKAYKRCLISFAIASFSSAVYSITSACSFLAGCGSLYLLVRKITKEMAIANTEAMKEKWTPWLKTVM